MLKTHVPSDGDSTAVEAEHNGHKIRVVGGYDISVDSFVVHVYVTPPGGERRRIGRPRQVRALNGGIEEAFEEAQRDIDGQS